MKVEIEVKPLHTTNYNIWGVRVITQSLYNRFGLGPTEATARAYLLRNLPGGEDYEFEVVGF